MKRTRLSSMSEKRKRESKEYMELRKTFLEEHPKCQGCQARSSTDVHHREKRGKNYLKVSTWIALCRTCHEYIEMNKSWAREKGWLK